MVDRKQPFAAAVKYIHQPSEPVCNVGKVLSGGSWRIVYIRRMVRNRAKPVTDSSSSRKGVVSHLLEYVCSKGFESCWEALGRDHGAKEAG